MGPNGNRRRVCYTEGSNVNNRRACDDKKIIYGNGTDYWKEVVGFIIAINEGSCRRGEKIGNSTGIHTNCSPDVCKTKLTPSESNVSGENTFDGVDESDDVGEIINQEYRAWRDATDDTEDNAITSSPTDVDSRMICDIRELSSHLVAKAENLLGEYNINKQ